MQLREKFTLKEFKHRLDHVLDTLEADLEKHINYPDRRHEAITMARGRVQGLHLMLLAVIEPSQRGTDKLRDAAGLTKEVLQQIDACETPRSQS